MSEVAEGLKRTGQPKPYQAHVQRGGRRVHLGSFAIAEEAALRVARSPEAQAAGAERTAAAEQAAAAAPLTSEGARLSSGSVRKSGTAVKMKRSPVKKKRASTKMPRVRVSASFLEFAERRTNQLWEEAEGTGVTGTEVLRHCCAHTRPPLDVALHHTHTTSRLWQISSQVCREFAARSLG